MENKEYVFSFELNYWTEAVHKRFNEIRASGTFKKVSLSTGKKEVTEDYLNSLAD